MKKFKTKQIVLNSIFLLIPLLLYSLYKNGLLIYKKDLIPLYMIFKPLYLVLISIIIKIIVDLFRYKKVKLDYNFLILILVAMIVPYNIDLIIYSVSVLVLYVLSLFIEKYINVNKVCFIYLFIILASYFLGNLSFKTPLEENFAFSFSYADLLMGRSIGGISSTSIFFSLIAYILLLTNYYYKKSIPFIINATYIFIALIYYIVTKDGTMLLNSELVFASVFVATLPQYSPYSENHQKIYALAIGLLTFVLSFFINSIVSVYLVIFILSIVGNFFKVKRIKD